VQGFTGHNVLTEMVAIGLTPSYRGTVLEHGLHTWRIAVIRS